MKYLLNSAGQLLDVVYVERSLITGKPIYIEVKGDTVYLAKGESVVLTGGKKLKKLVEKVTNLAGTLPANNTIEITDKYLIKYLSKDFRYNSMILEVIISTVLDQKVVIDQDPVQENVYDIHIGT